MAAVKSTGTKPEMLVRRFLFARGLRYRVNSRKLPGSPDITLRKYRAVVFVDGCFWHGHQGCKLFKLPATNTDFWRQKINMNIARDFSNNVELKLAGWRVFRIWECELNPASRRAETLENLYHRITKSPYPAAGTISTAAEPSAPYGK